MREAAASTTEIARIFSPRRTEYGLDAVRAHNGRLARAVASSEARGGATPFGRNIDERFRGRQRTGRPRDCEVQVLSQPRRQEPERDAACGARARQAHSLTARRGAEVHDEETVGSADVPTLASAVVAIVLHQSCR